MAAAIFRSRTIAGVWALTALIVGGKPLARADAVAELASFSVFPKVNLAQLGKGEYKTMRSGSAGNARYLAVQTAYVVPGSPAEVLAKMRSWNPARYPELKVYLHSDSGTDFPGSSKLPAILPSPIWPARPRNVPPICNSAPRKRSSFPARAARHRCPEASPAFGRRF